MDPFVAEIRIFGFNFAPTGWATCGGQLLPIAQNTALFSLLGTFYGGNGTSTFALPNLEGCSPLGIGQGAGLSPYELGQAGGDVSVALQTTELPQHAHELNYMVGAVPTAAPGVSAGLGNAGVAQVYANASGADVPMVQQNLQATGGGVAHNNRSPFLALNFCIAMQGVYPPRT